MILAGGIGTRLRPLSCTRPKMLFPVANKPLLDWTLEKLGKNKVKTTILAINYMADAFIKRYGEKAHRMKIFYSRDLDPAEESLQFSQESLGTGGSIKKAEKLIEHNEPFLVLNGDILTNISYVEFVRKHKASSSIATIALHEVEDPSRYGVVELTDKGRIVRFVEKPSREEAPSNLVNAGIYALNPEIFEYIPKERRVSIEHEIFPKLAEEGKLQGHIFQGYWTDIGEPSDYLRANRLLLDLETRKEKLGKNATLDSESEIRKPYIIGENAGVGGNTKIGPYAAIGEDVIIGKGVRIENSIIFPRTAISDFASIKGAIIGEAAIIGRYAKIEGGCIVGDNAIIQDNVTLTQGVSVCPSKHVTGSDLTTKCLM
jgi:NDP-sugar pyrophosphorylase family protein